MPFMASARTILLLLCAYVIFVYFEHSTYKSVHEKVMKRTFALHAENLKQHSEVDSLITGGSNAVFSLSAESLSSKLGGRWYNAALLSEGYTDQVYDQFLERLNVSRGNITAIVYSTVQPFIKGAIGKRKDREEKKTTVIRPNQSAIGHIKDLFFDPPSDIVPPLNLWGDLLHSRYDCTLRGEATRERERIDTSAEWLSQRLRSLSNIFPNASIYVVLPEINYEISGAQVADFEEQVRLELLRRLGYVQSLSGKKVEIIFQPPFSSDALTCEAPPHANEEGRKWRTNDLFRRLHESHGSRS
jgi:hypothetical protein